MTIEKRNRNLDLIRCVALLCVISLHFFSRNGFYGEIVSGWKMYIMVLLRSICLVCVPLFVILSGYLLNRKQPNKDFYIKLKKTLCMYLLACLVCLFFRLGYWQEDFSLVGTVAGILDYSYIQYAWYIEMYIGLFLLIPFLNILYNNIPSRNTKLLLLVVMSLLTGADSLVNIYNWFNLDWWITPSISQGYYELVPNWWIGVWPITYYFIGCYLHEYPLRLNRASHTVLLFLSFLLFGTFNFYRSYDSWYFKGSWEGWGSVFVMIQSILLFSLLSAVDLNGLNKKTASLLAKVSELSLGAFMVSWIYDQLFYDVLNTFVTDVQSRVAYFGVMVCSVLFCSIMTSAVLNVVYQYGATISVELKRKIIEISGQR